MTAEPGARRLNLTDQTAGEYRVAFCDYLLGHHSEELANLLLSEQTEKHYGFQVDVMRYMNTQETIGNMLFHFPVELLPIFDDGLRIAMQDVNNHHPLSQNMTWKTHVHVRLTGWPPDLIRTQLPRSVDCNRFLALRGTVIRVSAAKMREEERLFECSKCKHTFTVQAVFEQYYTIPLPNRCPSDSDASQCMGSKFKEVSETDGPGECRDYQEIKVQEQVSTLKIGTIPRALTVILEDDLADACKPGDDVTISGTVLRRWKPMQADERCEAEIVLHANHALVNNEQRAKIRVTDDLRKDFLAFWEQHRASPMDGRNQILASICPQVFGLYIVKLAVAMVLIGGVPRVDKSGTRVRGESHMLLVGDPGTGKSQFLKYAAKLIPRSVTTTGIGSTSAGLTVTAVKDGGGWVLEAGALVLADGGLCCIDEFNSIREADRGSIHEAMEQQTLSVAKAGLVCKLNTRTTVLAATNPKGKYDPEQALTVNIAVASPLLSRFDLVMVLLDTQHDEWDQVVSSFILGLKNHPALSEPVPSAHWGLEKLQAYICFVKGIEPALTAVSEQVLSRYYQMQRLADGRNQARTTIRLLESMVRLAQAHARLMCRPEVTLQDAINAIVVMEATMQGTALLPEIHVLHASFPTDAAAEYVRNERVVLTKLGLEGLIGTHSGLPGILAENFQPGSQSSASKSTRPAPPSYAPPDEGLPRFAASNPAQTTADLYRASGNGPLPKRRCGVASELEFSATQVPSTQVRGLYALSQDTPAASQYSTVEVHLPSVGQSGQLSQPNTAAISDGNDLDITLDEDDLLLPLNTGSGLGISMAAPAMRPETGSAVAPKPVDSNTTNDATDDWFGNEIAALRSRAGQA